MSEVLTPLETPIQVHSKALQAYRLKGLFHPHPAPVKSVFPIST